MVVSDWQAGWEQGKLEANNIMRQLASMEPWDRNQLDGVKCVFCNADRHREQHEFNCLWMHATRYVEHYAREGAVR
jgi:hypothetical protein